MPRRRRFVADLHVHSYLSRACSALLRPEPLHRWAQLKGVGVLSTGDFTHPDWRRELKDKLIEAEGGLLRLGPSLARLADRDVPESCRAPVRFVLGGEIACIYKKGPKVRRLHHMVYCPDWGSAERLVAALMAAGANLSSDGRPITGIDSRRLLEMTLSAGAHLIPAHAWTPHFGVFGSESGFDSLEECFEDLAPHVFAIETGLSSDPPMNWRVPALDRLALISSSDAHSPDKLGREATLFDAEPTFRGIFGAMQRRDRSRLLGTLEFFPQEGKYHEDGHRACGARLSPEETAARGGLCPGCGKPVTVGVLNRVRKLAGRGPGRPEGAGRYEHLVPLREIIGETLKVGPQSVKVQRAWSALLESFGPELFILRELDVRRLADAGHRALALAIARMRRGEASVEPGYDGVYGKVKLLRDEDFAPKGQLALV